MRVQTPDKTCPRGEPPSSALTLVGRFKQLCHGWSFLLHLVADQFGPFLELRSFSLFVHEDNADRADGLTGLILHHQFDFEVICGAGARRRRLKHYGALQKGDAPGSKSHIKFTDRREGSKTPPSELS